MDSPGARAEMPLTERLKDFHYHTVDPLTSNLMAETREAYYRLAVRLVSDLPESREKSLALTYLEDSLMRAIQSLAVRYGTLTGLGEDSNADA